ncbi:MAG: glycosyltransferase family 4 protein [Pyrinomonadaceae bacterium]|nr:glycosyltransferase family 4 protein [Pyrinomonadaceae bacterium]
MSKPEPISVLIVAPAEPLVGGQAVQASRLVEKFRDDDEVEVGFLAANPAFIPPLQKIKYVRTVLTTFRYILSLLVNIPKYEIIHVFSASFSSFLLAPAPAILLGKLFGKKVLLNYRSGFLEKHLTTWPKSTIPLIRKCDVVVTPSRYLVDVFEKFGIKARSVHNFVTIDKYKFETRNELRPRFLSNRNFEDLYNVGCTISAFARIREEFPEATLTIAGSGPQEQELRRLVGELGSAGIEFVGTVPQKDMPGLYAKADIYLNSPNIDNMPNSILEAFASGTAVVTTNAGGIPYIVEHERNGLMVEIGDDKALAEQAFRLLRDKHLAVELAEGGRSDLEKFKWESVRDDWIDVYRSI